MSIGSDAYFSIQVAQGYDNLTCNWRKNGVPLSTGLSDTGSFYILDGETLEVSNLFRADEGSYDCIVSNPCGMDTSIAATLALCIADFNCSGAVSVQDIFDFLGAYFTGCLQGLGALPPRLFRTYHRPWRSPAPRGHPKHAPGTPRITRMHRWWSRAA